MFPILFKKQLTVFINMLLKLILNSMTVLLTNQTFQAISDY